MMKTFFLFTVASALFAAPTPKAVAKLSAPAPVIAATPSGRTVHYAERDVIPINTRVRFQTMIILPREESIVDVLSGDKENWVNEKAGNFAFTKPVFPDITTNLILITSSGNVYSFILAESSEKTPDLKVFVEPRSESMLTAMKSNPKFVPAVAVEDFKIQAARAVDQAALAEAESAKRIAEAEKKAQKELLMAKAAIPQQMKFEYKYEPQSDFNVVAIWNDGKFTYIAANPTDVPAVYEIKDDKPSLIRFDYRDGPDSGLYTVPKILDRFYLAIGRKKMHVTRQKHR
jgi:type IV secretory pathway VirB9-like protein